MFVMNMQAWRQRPYIRENHAPETIDALERQLRELTEAPPDQVRIEWGLRQMAWQRC